VRAPLQKEKRNRGVPRKGSRRRPKGESDTCPIDRTNPYQRAPINLRPPLAPTMGREVRRELACREGFPAVCHLLSLYLSVKRSNHVRREGLEIPTLIQKREEYGPLDLWRSSSPYYFKESISNTTDNKLVIPLKK
jgi:hypothetical protein